MLPPRTPCRRRSPATAHMTDTVFYGQKGVASTENCPSARKNALGWYDSVREEFWMFGGYGYVSSSYGTRLLWFIIVSHPTNNPLNSLNSSLNRILK